MRGRIARTVSTFIVLLLSASAVAAEPFLGLKAGLLATSSRASKDNASAYVVAGYQTPSEGKYYGYYGVEIEGGTTFHSEEWKGKSFGAFATFRTGGLRDDIYLKGRLGYIRNRITLASQGSTKNSLGLGVGLGGRLGRDLSLELDVTFAARKVVGSDELVFFGLGLIHSF